MNMTGGTILGFACGLSLLALGAAETSTHGPGPFLDWPAKPLQASMAQAPVLISATNSHIHAILTVMHPSASKFDVYVLFQNQGVASTQEGFYANVPWKRSDLDTWVAKVKCPGDTNLFRVTVHGETNWSNSKSVVP
jgi:hypothetical protein